MDAHRKKVWRADRGARWAVRFAIVFFACEGVGLAFLTWKHGSIAAAFPWLDNRRLHVARSPGLIGPVPPGTQADAVFLLRNLWSQPIQVVGAAPC